MARPYRAADWLCLLAVLAAAAGARVWLLAAHDDWGRGDCHYQWGVQDRVATNMTSEWYHLAFPQGGSLDSPFVVRAPLSDYMETTSHVAPGYPYFLRGADWAHRQTDRAFVGFWAMVKWTQLVLGTLSCLCVFFLARRAFQNTGVALLAGLLAAGNPFWVLNTLEFDDGVLATFFVCWSLALGARVGQRGGVVTSLLFGLALAAAALVRAALLPFAIVTLVWFLWRSRTLRFGWMYALLAFLGFANGQGVWAVRNYQEFKQPLPVVSTAWYHLWVGNNPQADGGPMWDRLQHEDVLGAERYAELSKMESQPDRYAQLSREVREELESNQTKTVVRRWHSTQSFLLGRAGLANDGFVAKTPDDAWVKHVFTSFLMGVLFLALLGWRWSYAWRHTSMPLQLAMVWIPLPYILSHAELFHGPRLPFDGPLCCLAALAIGCLIPGFNASLFRGPTVAAEPPEEGTRD